jgi:hypothetical protein
MLCDVTPLVRQKFIDNSKEHTASIFRVDQYANQETSTSWGVPCLAYSSTLKKTAVNAGERLPS